ncbi:hypothetical protein D3C81_1653140 [compost metagenome]
MLFFLQPQGDADGGQQLFGLLALLGGHFAGGVQAADALTQQRRGVGHAAHDRLLAEPRSHAGAGDTGSNRNHQLIGFQAWANRFAHGFHCLRLDRQHDHIDAVDGLSVIGEGFDAVFGTDLGAGFFTRVAGTDLPGFQPLGAQAANQTGRHVARTDKRNTCVAHVWSLSGNVQDWE